MQSDKFPTAFAVLADLDTCSNVRVGDYHTHRCAAAATAVVDGKPVCDRHHPHRWARDIDARVSGR